MLPILVLLMLFQTTMSITVEQEIFDDLKVKHTKRQSILESVHKIADEIDKKYPCYRHN